MKHSDDSTMSLFGDEPTPAPATEVKKPRAKRQLAIQVAEVAPPSSAPTHAPNDTLAPPLLETPSTPAQPLETPALASASVAPQTRRNTPWADASGQRLAQVMLVITRGEPGGAQSHVLALCQQLAHRVQFTVVIGEQKDAWLALELRAAGIRVIELASLHESMHPLKLYRAMQDLLALIEQYQPDVIHAHSAIAGLVSRLAAHVSRRPVIYTVHGFAFKPQAPWLRRQLSHWAERSLTHITSEMICVSQYERELALQIGMDEKHIHTIANGIAATEPALAPVPNDASVTPIGLEPHAPPTPRLIMIARMNAPKRPDLLLQAAALLKQHLGYELPISFVGGGPELQTYQALGDQLGLEKITWHGDVHQAAALLQQHDIFVLLSDHEGMPITILEAMRAGKPIVASDLPGIREQIMHGQEGLLCANNPQAVAHELFLLIKDPFLAQRLGQAAQLHFKHVFTANRMAERVMQVYAQCLSRATPSTHASAQHSLVSATAQRRDALQNWSLWGAWLLIPSLFLSQLLQSASWVTYQFSDTLGWCILPYIVASQLIKRAAHLPAVERAGVLWVCTFVPFALTPLGFALLQHPYSRAALLWTYLITTLWFWWGYKRQVAGRTLRLVYFDAMVPTHLTELMLPHEFQAANLRLIAWNPQQNKPLPACDGLVIDERAPMSDERSQRLSLLKMQHLRLYSSEAVAELLSGRKILPRAQHSLWAMDNDPDFDRLKRLMDVCCVILLSPLWLSLCVLVAAAIKLDTPGPVFFVQTRVGRNGRHFKLLKFRSMVHGLQTRVEFASTNDPRITRVGRFIRRTRLDELPQLVNVLLGQMSLIGPRPEQTPFVQQFAATLPSYPYRHLVRPGLTGWAQVQQGYADSEDSTRLKLSYDLYYVEHYSFALDLLIAAKTLKIIFTGFGAR